VYGKGDDTENKSGGQMTDMRDATQSDLDYCRENSIDPQAKTFPDLQKSSWAKLAIFDGVILGCGGCVVYWNGCAEGWFCLTKESQEHKVVTINAIRDVIEMAFKELKLHRMQVTERIDNPQSIKLVEYLGFKREGLMIKYAPDGTDTYLYAMVK